MNDLPTSRDETSMLAVLPQAIVGELERAELVDVVPELRGPVADAAFIATSAMLGGTTVVAIRRFPGVGRAIADRIVAAAQGPGRTVEIRATLPDRTIELVLDRDTDPAAVAELIDAVYRTGPATTPAARGAGETDGTGGTGGRKVFVIHGRDMEATDAIFAFLLDLGLAPQEWEMLVRANGNPLPTLTDVVTSGLAPGAAQAVVAILTPDDIVELHHDLHQANEHWFEKNKQMQPRPDVLIEIGLALAAYREHMIIVEFGPPLRRISNLDGLNVIRFDNDEPEIPMGKLVERLRLAGCPVDDRGTNWRRTARFRDLASYKRRPE